MLKINNKYVKYLCSIHPTFNFRIVIINIKTVN